jgi:anti-anti-sigma factor
MNIRQNLPAQRLELSIPHDIISTRIQSLQQVFPTLEAAFAQSTAWRQLRIDLTGCKMVDSTGLNFLIMLQKNLESRGCRIAITGADKNLLRTFRFSRIDRYIELEAQ